MPMDSRLQGGLTGAAAGATVGAAAGPYGMAAGAVIGGVAGALTAPTSADGVTFKEARNYNRKTVKEVDRRLGGLGEQEIRDIQTSYDRSGTRMGQSLYAQGMSKLSPAFMASLDRQEQEDINRAREKFGALKVNAYLNARGANSSLFAAQQARDDRYAREDEMAIGESLSQFGQEFGRYLANQQQPANQAAMMNGGLMSGRNQGWADSNDPYAAEGGIIGRGW